ncbi:MAG TPA: serine/threonine-protein kinase [Pseudomonadota bacterium]|nr:serine/threonine-protein kinase [Pseudomonadota bacterium]
MNTPSREGEVIAQGRYKLNRSLGRGTFGDVYLAESTDPSHTAGQTQVVVKVLHAQWAQVAEVVERFRRESLVTRKIEHPHVARIFEHAQLADGVPYIVMEYLPGRSLRAQMDLGGLPYQECLGVLAAIADALDAAQRAGVVHRDLKPENIQLMERGGNLYYPIVLDFGVAKFLDAAEKLTMTGALLGTPAYMSPEQFRGETNLGPPADVYALAILAYELLSGVPPFHGSTFGELAIAHTTKPAPQLKNVPQPLADLLHRCLDKDPAKRPRAAAIATTLRGVQANAPHSQLVATRVDPYADTGKLTGDVRASLAQQTFLSDQASRRQRNLTILLAVAVFAITSAVGLLVYFFLF